MLSLWSVLRAYAHKFNRLTRQMLKPVSGVREAGHIFWPADDEDGREWRAGGPGPRPRDLGVPGGGVSPQYQLRSESYQHGHRASQHRQYGNHLLATPLCKMLNCTIYCQTLAVVSDSSPELSVSTLQVSMCQLGWVLLEYTRTAMFHWMFLEVRCCHVELK